MQKMHHSCVKPTEHGKEQVCPICRSEFVAADAEDIPYWHEAEFGATAGRRAKASTADNPARPGFPLDRWPTHEEAKQYGFRGVKEWYIDARKRQSGGQLSEIVAEFATLERKARLKQEEELDKEAESLSEDEVFQSIHESVGAVKSKSMQNSSSNPLGQTEDIDRTDAGCLDGLNRVVLIGHWRRRTGQIVNLIALDHKRIDDVMPHEFESRMPHQMPDVALPPCKQIIKTDDFVTAFEQTLAKMTAKKTSAARHKNCFHD